MGKKKIKVSSIRFGNVIGSRGSVIPNFISLLKKEENNHIVNEQHYCKRIKQLVKYIDGLAMTKPDKKITIIELCQFLPTEENSKTIKDLLNIKEIDDVKIDEEEEKEIKNKDTEDISLIEKPEKIVKEKEPIYLSISILFEKPVKVNYLGTRTIREPFCTGYGADFNNIDACTFIIPDDLESTLDEEYKLCGIDIECNVTDQNFGGTNQCHLRYKVNDAVLVKVIQVDRNQFPGNNYKFSIPPNEIKLGDAVKIWIFSPGWNGWSISLNSIIAKAKFI
jgi:hypothetical protein